MIYSHVSSASDTAYSLISGFKFSDYKYLILIVSASSITRGTTIVPTSFFISQSGGNAVVYRYAGNNADIIFKYKSDTTVSSYNTANMDCIIYGIK